MMHNLEAEWQQALAIAICNQCDWSFLVPPADVRQTCPHCFQVELEPLGEAAHALPTPPPELVVPFSADQSQINKQIKLFADGFWFSPGDLTPAALDGRLRKLFLPMWLVDSDVRTRWQAEVGFDYQVVSHVEQFHNGGWQTEERKETRTRWEPRMGELKRRYDNVRAPALEEHDELVNPLGKYKVWETEPYVPQLVEGTVIRVPNRSSVDAWTDAEPAFLQLVETDCRLASAGDHIRQFKWQPHFPNQHWTKLLLPVFTTYYFDDDGNILPLLIHGGTARVFGPRRASMIAARRMSTLLGAAAVLLFALSLLLMFTGVTGYVGLTVFVALFVGLLALFPIVYVYRFNRRHAVELSPKL